MLRDPRPLILTLLATFAAVPPSAAVAAGASTAAFEMAQAPDDKKNWQSKKGNQDLPPDQKQGEEQPPEKKKGKKSESSDGPQQRSEPKKERDQRQEVQQERNRENPDRAQRQQEKQQQRQQDRARQEQERIQQKEQQRAQRQQERLQQLERQRTQQKQDAERVRQDQQDRNQKNKDQQDQEQQNQERLKQDLVRQERARDLQPPQQNAQPKNPLQSPSQIRDNKSDKSDRKGTPPVALPPSAFPVGGNQPNVQQRATREDASRSARRDAIRENYRRAPKQQRSFDDLKRNRRERTISQGNLRVIEEPDRRVIVKQNNRSFIRHDESERFRRIAPDARTIRGNDGTSTTFMTRRGGVRIYDVSDRNGRLLHRYRRYPNGREVILIDNRRHYRRDKSRTRDVLIGAGIGLFIGSAIALAAPEVRIPRDEYIVDYGRASDDDLYEALTAPPIERLDRGYSLDEVRYSSNLRDRMRRIDLDTVTFDFGSWEVGPDQGRALDRLADGINRVLQRNPDEIFMIEGHTDAVGTQDDNLTLSDRRAQSVAEILTTEYGVAPENLVTQGYGEEQLKIPTDGPERLNRRITVRRIGPLLSGQFEEERYSGARPANDRIDDGDRGYEDLDDGPPDDGLPAVVPPDDGRTYDYDNDRYR